MNRQELIVVEMKDGTVCRMVGKALSLLLAHDKVAKFLRSNGWVVVGKSPLRDKNNSNNPIGIERRFTV